MAENKPSRSLSVQEMLSLGYVYLLALGILSDAIYYTFFDIDILNYVTLPDILLSPINILTHDLRVLLFLSITIGLLSAYTTVFIPKMHVRFRDHKWYQRFNNVEKMDQFFAQEKNLNRNLLLTMLPIMFIFLGYALGRGQKYAERIEDGTLKPDFELTLVDEDPILVKVIGQTSLFVIYVPEGEKEVHMAPIESNLQTLVKYEAPEEE